MSKSVHPQITDSVTQTSSHVLGLGPALAATSAYLGQAQAQTVLFANMVNQQQQSALLALTATTQSVKKLLGAKPPKRTTSVQNTSFYQHELTQTTSDEPQKPVVT